MKKKNIKRMLALMAASAMTVSGMSSAVFAETTGTTTNLYQPVNTYVLNHAGNTIAGYENWDQKYVYFSPYRTNIYIKENNYAANWCTSAVYNMINMGKIDPNSTAETPYASIYAYCVDFVMNSMNGFEYQRINLEDADYFSDETAGRIRAIYMNSFPRIDDMNAITTKVNEWIKTDSDGKGFSEVKDLNKFEVISATQSVIWTLTNDGYIVTDSKYPNSPGYAGYEGYTDDEYANGSNGFSKNQYPNYSIYGIEGYEAPADTNANNISAMMHYLLDLAPMGPQATLISNASFENTVKTQKINKDGTYSITVETTVDAVVSGDTELLLTVVVDGEVIDSKKVENGTKTYTFNLQGVSLNDVITLNIDGNQTAADVFLFDSKHDRDNSQTMAGYDNSTLPVHAELTIEPDRTITINKSTLISENGENVQYPLEGIQFDIHYVCTVDEYTANPDAYVDYEYVVDVTTEGQTEKITKSFDKYEDAATEAKEDGVDAKNITTVVDEDKLAEISVKDALTTVTTDITGKAVANITKLNGKDGIYLITEHDHIAIEEPKEPFYVAVPMTTTNGDGLTYNVVIEPKNDVIDGPEIRKDVTAIEKDLNTLDVNETHTWIIRTDIPVDLSQGKEYVITDTLDYRLTYKGNIVVKVSADKAGAVGTEVETLEVGTDYTVTTSQKEVVVNEVTEKVDYFEVALTKAGMAKVAGIVENRDDAEYANSEIRVYFDAVIDEDAQMGVLIPNQATLDYTNSLNFKYDVVSDIPEVYTCGINIYKYDANDKTEALAGAEFKLAVVVNEGTSDAMPLVTEDGVVYVKYVDFYNNATLTGDKADVVTTLVDIEGTEANEAGTAFMYGLKAGTYYLVETKAPSGYNLLSYPVKITLGSAAVDAEKETTKITNGLFTQEVANSNAFKLPATGGIGTVVFTVGGAMLIAMAMVILVVNKKREME